MIGLGTSHRTWIQLSLKDIVTVQPVPASPPHLESIDIEIALYDKNAGADIKADDLTKRFNAIYLNVLFTLGETFIFEFQGLKYLAIVKGLTIIELADQQKRGVEWERKDTGLLLAGGNTVVTFMKGKGGNLKLQQSAKRYTSRLLSGVR